MKKTSKLCFLFGNKMWYSYETVLLQQSLLSLPCLISFLGSLAGKAFGLSCAGNVVGKNSSALFWNNFTQIRLPPQTVASFS